MHHQNPTPELAGSREASHQRAACRLADSVSYLNPVPFPVWTLKNALQTTALLSSIASQTTVTLFSHRPGHLA